MDFLLKALSLFIGHPVDEFFVSATALFVAAVLVVWLIAMIFGREGDDT